VHPCNDVAKDVLTPTFLGFKWVNGVEAMINLKRVEMLFKAYGIMVIQAIGPIRRERYIDPMDDVMDGAIVDQIYNLMLEMRDYYINPTTNGVINKRSIYSYDLDSQEPLQY